MAFEVKFVESANIMAPHLKKPVFVEVHRADGSDNQFVDLTASHKVARILCLDGHQFYDCFGTVTVLDQIKSLRDDFPERPVVGMSAPTVLEVWLPRNF
jgi:hypothetical protein